MAIGANCCGVILSGGLNTRMGGLNKAFLELGGRSFLDHLLDRLNACFQETLIITREASLYAEKHGSARVVEDIFDVRSPLTGIHAGLVGMDSDFAFVTSCDTPLLTEEVIRMLLDRIEPDVDVIAPAQGTYYQPMCAIYARRCAPEIENMLRRGELKVDLLFNRVRLITVAYEELRAVDPQLRSFFNVNTPEDLKTARRMCAGSPV